MNDNKLIPEFMGLPLVPCSIGTEDGIVYEGYQHPKGGTPFTADGLQYKYSWDWLMPVVREVQTRYEVDEGIEIDYDELQHAVMDNDIERAYEEVVELIKQYNDGKQ